MTNLQYYKIVNKQTQEITIFEGENFNKIITFLKEKNAFPNYKTSYKIYLCFEGIHIIHGVETPAKTETGINPIFLVNKHTKEVVECSMLPMLLLFIESNNITDYDLFYDEEVDGGEILAIYDKHIIAKHKHNLLAELKEAYEKSKTIHVNNGNSFTLTYNDIYYNEFRKRIDESCSSTRENQFDKETFFCLQNNYRYTITLMNYVWKFVFYPTKANRFNNKQKYDTYLYQIENATSYEKIKNLSFDFDFKDGFVIDVNTITTNFMKELQTGKHPKEVAIEMQNFLSSQKDKEHIELVKKEEL